MIVKLRIEKFLQTNAVNKSKTNLIRKVQGKNERTLLKRGNKCKRIFVGMFNVKLKNSSSGQLIISEDTTILELQKVCCGTLKLSWKP